MNKNLQCLSRSFAGRGDSRNRRKRRSSSCRLFQ